MHIETETTTHELENFTRINHKGMGKIVLVKGDSYRMSITASPEFMGYIRHEVYANMLEIKMVDAWEVGLKSLFNLKKPDFKIIITYKHLIEITQRGIGEISNQGVMEVQRFTAINNGMGDIVLNLHCHDLTTKLQGVGGIYLQGEAENHTSEINGAGSLYAEALITQKTTVLNNGAGNSRVHAEKELYAEINGVGQIRYSGKPHVESRLNGIGNISPA